MNPDVKYTASAEPRWPASREAALRRLAEFLPRAGRHYAAQRNYDRGPGDRSNVSGLSPYLTHRLLGEWEVALAAADLHGFRAAEKFIQEVCWRTYWKGWLELRPGVWRDYLDELSRCRAGRPRRDQGLVRACRGETGIECFDAWARELVTTGYLHNHARMWFASIWIFTLKLPWPLGADFFYRHLLDGDAASNTLSWRWVAGLQTRGKHYLARPGNIARFTENRFGPARGLDLSAGPLAGDAPPPPGSLDLPAAEPPRGRYGLLLLDHDLMPESLDLPRPAAVAACATARLRSSEPISERVVEFANAAVADALARGGSHFGLDAEQCETLPDLQAVVRWASRQQFETVVSSYVPVGPAADRMPEFGRRLVEAGCRLMQRPRPWDVRAWPHATKGFFPFKKKIGMLLESAGR